MIYIERTNEFITEELRRKADNEHNDAESHYLSHSYFGDKSRPAYDHLWYKEPLVKESLKSLFNGKCAYCEVNIIAGFDIDKEHFRPKGRIETNAGKIRPGYYWLAADWTNLFSSCVHCNEQRVQKCQDGTIVTIGKGDQFPLSDDTKYARSKNHESDDSYRLLIDPCSENPEKYFQFDSEGSISVKDGLSAFDHRKAETSLCVFALIRIDLVLKRKAHYKRISLLLEKIMEGFKDFIEDGSERRMNLLKKSLEELEELSNPKDSTNEFIAITRQLKGAYRVMLVNAINSLNEY